MLGHRHAVGAAVISHGDPQLIRQSQVHLVVTGAKQLDQFALLGRSQDVIGQDSGPDDQEVRVRHHFHLLALADVERLGDYLHARRRLVRHHLPEFRVQFCEAHHFRSSHLILP